MIEAAMATFVTEVGVPVAAFIFIYALYLQNQKWQQKQQEKTDERFDHLIESFIDSVKEITYKQNKALDKHTDALVNHTIKLDERIKLIDEFIEYIKEERRTHGS